MHQPFGGKPGEDFDMQNPNLRSKIAKSVTQRPNNEKNELSISHRGGTRSLDFTVGLCTLRRSIIVPLCRGLILSPGVVLVVLVLVFVIRGVVFLILVDVVACHYVYYH